MSQSLVKQLLEAGIHYGHKASNWNPKMQPYIFAKRNGIHIIDVRETIKGLLLARKFLTRVVAQGKEVLVVGTKRQAAAAIASKCLAAEVPFVTERWLGGTLTNFRTIRSRLKRLEELEGLMSGEEWGSYSKKMASQLTRERKKIDRNLSGIRRLTGLPGAVVVIDVNREVNALRESQKLGIPTVCLIDTDSDPDLSDIPIPGNDDAIRAIEMIVDQIIEAVKEGRTARAQAKLERKDAGVSGGEGGGRRRSSRVMASAEVVSGSSAASGGEAGAAGAGGDAGGGGEAGSDAGSDAASEAESAERAEAASPASS